MSKPIALYLGQYGHSLGEFHNGRCSHSLFFHLDEKGGGGGDRFSLSRSFDLCFLFVFWRIAGWKIGPRGNSGESSKRRKKKRLGQVG